MKPPSPVTAPPVVPSPPAAVEPAGVEPASVTAALEPELAELSAVVEVAPDVADPVVVSEEELGASEATMADGNILLNFWLPFNHISLHVCPS